MFGHDRTVASATTIAQSGERRCAAPRFKMPTPGLRFVQRYRTSISPTLFPGVDGATPGAEELLLRVGDIAANGIEALRQSIRDFDSVGAARRQAGHGVRARADLRLAHVEGAA